MPSYVTPKRATEFIFYVGLVSQSDTKTFQSNPTIAAGDFKVSKDGGALANLTTLPAVTPASSKLVKVTLSVAEMTADNVTVVGSDAAGAQWCDVIVNIQTSTRQIDDLAYPATSGRAMDVSATNRLGLNLDSTEGALTNADVAWIDSNDRVKANADQLASSATGATQLALSANRIVTGTVDTTSLTPTTTSFEADDITEATAEHYKGRRILFTAGNLNNQATVITAYQLVGGRGRFTVQAMTEAPANNDTFIIV